VISNPGIDDAVAQLEKRGFRVTRCEHEGYAVLILEEYAVPPGWSKRATRMLLKLPVSFPNGKPDMFWTDRDLTLAGGAVPDRADSFESIGGASWRRFSWHPQTWTPGKDDIGTFLEFIDRRLAQRK
jgi:E2/UBC family protein E